MPTSPSFFLAVIFALPAAATLAQQPTNTENADADAEITETVRVIGSRKGTYTVVTEDTQKLLEMPGTLGDPLGAISALPGVITPASGGAPAVRGSSPSDNRYYIDGMPAGYIFHQFNTSILDENVVQDFQLHSAGFGAQYSDATGAVFDIRLRDPSSGPVETTITASLLRAGALVEGSVSENAEFYLSARMGLLQFFFPSEDEPDEDGFRVESPPEDGDYVFKYVWTPSAGKLSVNLVGARDFAEVEFTEQSDFAAKNPDFAGDAALKKTFHSQSVNWLQTLDSGAELSLSLGQFIDDGQLRWGAGYSQNVEQTSRLARTSLSIPLSPSHTLVTGADFDSARYDYSTREILFVCTEFDPSCQDGRGDLIEESRKVDVEQTTLYAIDRWQVTPTLNLEAGLQWHRNSYTDEQFIHPRVSLAWEFLPYMAFTSSAGRYNRFPDLQYVVPVLGNPQLDSQQAQHYTVGLEGDFASHWNWSAELYQKHLSDLPLALNAAQADAGRLYSNDVEGEARGLDLFLNRNLANNWYGWVALSYAESERTNLRTGESQSYALDTPLVFNLVANYRLSRLWDIGTRFTAKSGEADTRIVGIKENPDFAGNYLPIYSDDVYGDRLPTYSRLDLRLNRDTQIFGRNGKVFVDVLNVLGRKNINSRELDYERVNSTGELHIKKEGDLGRIASVGFSVTF